MSREDLYDVTIVGGGPTGLYTAFYSGMRDMRTKIIECQPRLGGKMHFYLDKVVWDIGGLPPTSGERCIDHLVGQSDTFEPAVVLGERVVAIDEGEDGVFALSTDGGTVHRSRTVILATGSGVVSAERLKVEGAERYEATNLRYTVDRLEDYRGRRVLISGGGNSAVDWANALEPLAGSVTVVHRRDEFAGHEGSVLQMKRSPVEVLTPYEITALTPGASGEEIRVVTLSHIEGEGEREIEVDAVVVNHGYHVDLGFVGDGKYPLKDNCILVNEGMETNVPGIFAAGDLVTYEGKLHLIAGGFVEGATAANSAKLYLQPDAEESAYVSSHNERFADKNRELQMQGAESGE